MLDLMVGTVEEKKVVLSDTSGTKLLKSDSQGTLLEPGTARRGIPSTRGHDGDPRDARRAQQGTASSATLKQGQVDPSKATKTIKFDQTRSAVNSGNANILSKIPVPVVPTAPAAAEGMLAGKGKISELTKLVSADGEKSSSTIGKIKLAIHLPGDKRDKITINVHETSTVEGVIKETLKHPALAGFVNNPDQYELRIPDDDGIADEEFPSLDRKRKIREFESDSGSGSAAFCLVQISHPSHSHVSPAAALSNKNTSLRRFSDAKNLKRRGSDADVTSTARSINDAPSYIKVTIDTTTSIVAITPTMTARDLLAVLEKKKILTAGKEYVFNLTEDDWKRLNMLGPELDFDSNIKSLNVSDIELKPKTYADTPSMPSGDSNKERRKITSSHNNNERPDIDSFMYNDHTAATLQEWVVIKINQRGKRQERLMGIDQLFIHNRRLDGSKLNVLKRVVHGGITERPIKDIIGIDFTKSNPCGFWIQYKEGADDKLTLEYEAGTARDAAEIVAKIQYIQKHLMH
jgi:hypothetical protein